MCEQPPGSGWVWVSTGARPGSLAPTGLHWHRRSLAPAPALRQTEDSSGQASETLFSFSVFFLFVSSFSVVYHTRCIWFARCLYGDYPLSLYRCYLVFSINHNCACNVQKNPRHLTQKCQKWNIKVTQRLDRSRSGQEGLKVATL